MKALLNFLTIFATVLSLLICKKASSEPLSIKIGLTLGLTGIYSDIADQQMKGFRLWEKDTNERGGILGRRVEVLIYDDKGDPNVSKVLYERLMKDNEVDLIFGPYSSAITEAVAPIANKYKYPMLASGASADSIWEKGYRYIFGVYEPASKYSLGFLKMLVINNIDGIALIYADDSFSENVANGTKKWAKRLGLSFFYVSSFKKSTKDLISIVKKAKESGAKVLIVCGHLEESIQVKLLIENIKWQPIYFATVGPATDKYYQKLRNKSELTFSSSQWENSISYPKSIKFNNAFMDRYKIAPSYHAATAYATGQILEAAIRKAKSLDREKIRNILSFMDTMTIIGRYKVDKSGSQIKHQNLIIQWQRGKREIVWPDTIKTAQPLFSVNE